MQEELHDWRNVVNTETEVLMEVIDVVLNHKNIYDGKEIKISEDKMDAIGRHTN